MAAPVRTPPTPASITAAIVALLGALDGTPPGSPAGNAYVSALRRRGEDLAALGGVEALREARAVAVAASPDYAGAIDEAWSAVPGWNA